MILKTISLYISELNILRVIEKFHNQKIIKYFINKNLNSKYDLYAYIKCTSHIKNMQFYFILQSNNMINYSVGQ